MKKLMLIMVAFMLFGSFTKAQNSLLVTNLHHTVQSEDLNVLFSQYGAVSSAKVIADRESGRSRGFGFVEMVAKEEAARAIEELSGKEFKGRVIKVEIANPRNPSNPSNPSDTRNPRNPRRY
jgi:RNA recognition motif-containing protein